MPRSFSAEKVPHKPQSIRPLSFGRECSDLPFRLPVATPHRANEDRGWFGGRRADVIKLLKSRDEWSVNDFLKLTIVNQIKHDGKNVTRSVLEHFLEKDEDMLMEFTFMGQTIYKN